jgi:hypothetical protein
VEHGDGAREAGRAGEGRCGRRGGVGRGEEGAGVARARAQGAREGVEGERRAQIRGLPIRATPDRGRPRFGARPASPWETPAGDRCRRSLQEIAAGDRCGRLLRGSSAGVFCGGRLRRSSAGRPPEARSAWPAARAGARPRAPVVEGVHPAALPAAPAGLGRSSPILGTTGGTQGERSGPSVPREQKRWKIRWFRDDHGDRGGRRSP